MVRFLELRNLLMDQHSWNRRIATMAARIYMGVDTPADLEASQGGADGIPYPILLTEGEYREICGLRVAAII